MLYKIDKYAKQVIRSKMILRNIDSEKMSYLLNQAFDEKLTEKSFNNKLSRANFSAKFFFRCMYILDINSIEFNKKLYL
jgi:hypothetical protein